MTLSLILESSTERSFIAIIQNNALLYHHEFPFGLHNSQHFVPQIEKGFKEINKRIQEVDYIGVGTGPGSYTGIRVGAAVGKALSYSCKIPLVGVCSLEAFAPDADGPFAAVIDARLGGVYVLIGNKTGQSVIYSSPPKICGMQNLEEILQKQPLVIGPSLDPIKKKVKDFFPHLDPEWVEVAPDPLGFNRIAQKKFENKDFSLDGSLELLYLRD